MFFKPLSDVCSANFAATVSILSVWSIAASSQQPDVGACRLEGEPPIGCNADDF